MTDTSAKRTDTRRRWLSSALLTVLLALGLIVTTLAISTKISVERNFTTGTVKLNLNGSLMLKTVKVRLSSLKTTSFSLNRA